MTMRTGLLLLGMVIGATVTRGEPPITALCFTPDGRSVIAGSTDGLVMRTGEDLADTELIATSLEHVHDLRFSGDGQLLAAVGGIPAERGVGEVFVWPSRQLQTRWEAGEDVFYAVDWLPDRTGLAVAALDAVTRVISAETGEVLHQWTGHSRGVTAVCLLPAGDPDAAPLVVTAGIDQTLRVVDMATGETVRTLHNHTAPIHALTLRPAVNSGLPIVASASDDRTVRFWQPTIGRMIRFAQIESVPLCQAWTTNGGRIVVGCADGHVRIIDPDTAGLLEDKGVFESRVTSLAMHPKDAAVAVGSQSGEIALVRIDVAQ